MPSSAELLDYLRRRLSQPQQSGSGEAARENQPWGLQEPIAPPPAPPRLSGQSLPSLHISPLRGEPGAGRRGGPAPGQASKNAQPSKTSKESNVRIPKYLEKYRDAWVSICSRYPDWCVYINAVIEGRHVEKPNGSPPIQLIDLLAIAARDMPDELVQKLEKALGVNLHIMVNFNTARAARLLLEMAKLAKEALERKGVGTVKLEKIKNILAGMTHPMIRKSLVKELASTIGGSSAIIESKLRRIADALAKRKQVEAVRELASLYDMISKSRAFASTGSKGNIRAFIGVGQRTSGEEKKKEPEAARSLAAVKSLLRK